MAQLVLLYFSYCIPSRTPSLYHSPSNNKCSFHNWWLYISQHTKYQRYIKYVRGRTITQRRPVTYYTWTVTEIDQTENSYRTAECDDTNWDHRLTQ